MFNVKSLLAAAALVSAVALSASSASAAFLDFDDTSPATGKVSYVGKKLIGTGIGFQTVLGVDTPLNNGVTTACNACVLNFETGTLAKSGNLPNGNVAGLFNGGGFFTITGAGGTVLTGTFASAGAILSPTTGFADFSGTVDDASIAAALGAFFGIPTVGTASGTAVVRLTNPKNPAVWNADVNFTPVPLPAALPLFLTALAGVGLVGRRSAKVA